MHPKGIRNPRVNLPYVSLDPLVASCCLLGSTKQVEWAVVAGESSALAELTGPAPYSWFHPTCSSLSRPCFEIHPKRPHLAEAWTPEVAL